MGIPLKYELIICFKESCMSEETSLIKDLLFADDIFCSWICILWESPFFFNTMLCVPIQVTEPSDVGLFHPKANCTGNDVVIILCF